MAIQKIKLTRIKTDLSTKTQNIPDYDGFFNGQNGDFYVVGWLRNLSSDLDLNIQKVDGDFLKNKFNLKKYSDWKFKKPKG
jgi:hypothetical protein